MDQIIKSLSERLGLTEDVIRKSLYVLLEYGHKHIAGTPYEKYFDQIPGITEFIASKPADIASDVSSSGLLGGLSSLLGSQFGDAAKVLAGLEKAGLPTSKIGPFVQAFLDQAREVAGPESVDAFVKSIPILDAYLGKSSK